MIASKTIALFLAFLSVSSGFKSNFNDNSLKSEILKYKTSDCVDSRDNSRMRTRNRHGLFGMDFAGGYESGSDEEPEYRPNPYLYVGDRSLGYGLGRYEDTLGGYVPQDVRNKRKNADNHRSTYKYARQGSLRSFNYQNNEDQCVSQCVFNNMEIVGEDGSPSESLMLKWVQDKIRNDRKRMQSMKEIRRCFDAMSESDKEDGCELSKYLSECLNLGLDDQE